MYSGFVIHEIKLEWNGKSSKSMEAGKTHRTKWRSMEVSSWGKKVSSHVDTGYDQAMIQGEFHRTVPCSKIENC